MGDARGNGGTVWRGIMGRKNGATVIVQPIKYIKNKNHGKRQRSKGQGRWLIEHSFLLVLRESRIYYSLPPSASGSNQPLPMVTFACRAKVAVCKKRP